MATRKTVQFKVPLLCFIKDGEGTGGGGQVTEGGRWFDLFSLIAES